MAQGACHLWAPGDLAFPGQRAWLGEVEKAAWPPPGPTTVRASPSNPTSPLNGFLGSQQGCTHSIWHIWVDVKCCLLTLPLACSPPANHLSPQALKWREYRRKNPLGPPGLSGSLDRRPQEARLARRNPIFEFPGSLGTASHLSYRLNGVWPESLV